MENMIERKIERVNKMLKELDMESKDTNSRFLQGLDSGQRIAYKFMIEELRDLQWHYRREK